MEQANSLTQPNSFIDPAGVVYENSDVMLRGIRSPYVDFYAALKHNPKIQAMLGEQLVETQWNAEKLDGYSLTLQHRKITPLNFCYEWIPLMLKDAALQTLEICINLSSDGLTLQDATPWNVVYEHTHPYFVDISSIVTKDAHLLWEAYDQFVRLFLLPLLLYQYFPDRMVRGITYDSIQGISRESVIQVLPMKAMLRTPWLLGRLFLPHWVLSFMRQIKKEKSLSGLMKQINPKQSQREGFFTSLRQDVLSIDLKPKNSQWTRYYQDMDSFFFSTRYNQKQTVVANVLQRIHPKTVLDVGCNRGGYAVLAAQSGAKVVAFDTDVSSIGLLYQLAKDHSLKILPLVMDVLNPSPSCGWRQRQFTSADQRFRSEMVMALALVHHLAITQLQSFERIVSALSDYVDKWLLTEFVPLDDVRSQELRATQRRNMDRYTLDVFIAALRCEFSVIETFPSYPEGRTLILCRR